MSFPDVLEAGSTTAITMGSNNDGVATIQVPPVLEDPPRAVLLANSTAGSSSSNNNVPKLYWDRSHYSSPSEQMKALQQSSTVYVGNVSFTIKTHHIHHHFTSLLSSTGMTTPIIQRIILGVDRNKEKPCGFCFVEFVSRRYALQAVSMITGTQLDGKVIRVELDAGYQPGRQYGRGKFGGQVRDERRNTSMLQQQQQQLNSNNKRSRNDTTTTTTSATTEMSVTTAPQLDAPLPSGRNPHHQNNTINNNNNINDASNAIDSNTTTENQNDDTDDIQQEQPRAKRMKLED